MTPQAAPVPNDWTPTHSVAALLIGMAMIDGEVDDTEMQTLIEVMRDLPGVDATEIGPAAHRVYTYLWEQVDEEEVGLIPTLRDHGDRIASRMDPPTLQAVLTQLEAVADADGVVHPMEARLIEAFRQKWPLP